CDQNAPILYDRPEPMPSVISYAVSATNEKDEEKLFSVLTRLLDEDPTLKMTHEYQTHEVLISGVGQVHLDALKDKLKRKFSVEMELAQPKIPYKETLKAKTTAKVSIKSSPVVGASTATALLSWSRWATASILNLLTRS
ncbi:Elongation Factor G, domain II, partial [Candidatus Electrothrix marina]